MKATEEEKAQLRTIFIPLTAAEIIWDYVRLPSHTVGKGKGVDVRMSFKAG